MRIHLIAIGGAVMHNLALALSQNGHHVSGSDDVINEPSKSRLKKAGLLPTKEGWYPEQINESLDLVILGMHARKNNPELLKAQQLGMDIQSFPEYIANHSQDKKRIVIAGSHGKTTSTAMLMHALEKLNLDFDYLVGSKLPEYDTMVRLSDAKMILIEGDEYLTSPLDLKPKFLWYTPHLSMITGIAWDHINVFPTYEGYVKSFQEFVNTHQPNAQIFYFSKDDDLINIASQSSQMIPYSEPKYKVNDDITQITIEGQTIPLSFFGKHNIQNAAGVAKLIESLGYSTIESWKAVASFTGTANRLELIYKSDKHTVYRDFAHSPSKLKATVHAIRERYPNEKIYAYFELHTFSSLQADFLPHYKNAMDQSDQAFVYVDAHLFEHRQLPSLALEQIENGFGKVKALNSKKDLFNAITESLNKDGIFLFMSSGQFSGIDLDQIFNTQN